MIKSKVPKDKDKIRARVLIKLKELVARNKCMQ